MTSTRDADIARMLRANRLVHETRWEAGWSRERYVRENLAEILSSRRYFGRGNKRIRRKKIKPFLLGRAFRMHLAVALTAPLYSRLNYASMGRRMFLVEPLPEPTLGYYARPLA